MTRTLYRIVRTNPPTVSDFLSDDALGRGSADESADVRRLRAGCSVFNTEAQARRRAKAFPLLGRYIAVLSILDDPDIQIKIERSPGTGHHTIWDDREWLLRDVTAVVPV
jgi:hypothetical protein